MIVECGRLETESDTWHKQSYAQSVQVLLHRTCLEEGKTPLNIRYIPTVARKEILRGACFKPVKAPSGDNREILPVIAVPAEAPPALARLIREAKISCPYKYPSFDIHDFLLQIHYPLSTYWLRQYVATRISPSKFTRLCYL